MARHAAALAAPIASRTPVNPPRQFTAAAALALLSGLLLAACAAPPPYRAGAGAGTSAHAGGTTVLPQSAPDIARIPDAVPRYEPRSPLGNPPFYAVYGHRYVVLSTAVGYDERGVASWYGPQFHGLRTATGEPYDMFAMTAAHKTLPLPCYARVTNLSNGRSVVVRINDRGPFVANRIIDLSYTAAAKLDMIRSGTAFVEVQTLTAAPGPPTQTVSLPANSPAAAALGPSNVPPVSAATAAALPLASTASAATVATAPSVAHEASVAGTAPVPSVGADQFYIQVGAFSRLQNAQHAASTLRAAGLPAFMLAPDARASLLRVRVGPVASVQQFDALIARLRSLGYPGARLAQD